MKYQDARFDDTALGYVNQYGKTMDNWNKSMYASPDKSELVTAENDLISPGVKRNKYQAGQMRSLVNQSQSLQDKREIFSEEDFSHPEFHQFRLPEFSKAHHECLFESQQKKLKEQIRVFEENDKRSKLQSSHSKVSQPGMFLESRDSFKGSCKDSGLGANTRFMKKLGSQESKSLTPLAVEEENETQRKGLGDKSIGRENLHKNFDSAEGEITDRVDFETHRDDEEGSSKSKKEEESKGQKPKLSAAVEEHIFMAEMDEEQPFSRESDDEDPILGRFSNAGANADTGPKLTQQTEESKEPNRQEESKEEFHAYGQDAGI